MILLIQIFLKYLLANKPCILKNVSNDWPCQTKWIKNGKINFEYLNKLYGECTVPVADCGERYYNSQKKCNLKLKDYISYWNKYTSSGYPQQMPSFYLKDWHFQQNFPNDAIYEVPKYFASDWLNEFTCSEAQDDYRFVYIGPKGTWTPFHADVFNSFSWSTNVHGSKKWLLFAPGKENLVKDKFGNLPYDYHADDSETHHIEVHQKAGETIFVPSGWYHQVWNIEDTISINHNSINGCNVSEMWKALQANFIEVENEILHCSDMEDFAEHCQVMLKANFGIDFNEFFMFLFYIVNKRIQALKKNEKIIHFHKWNLSTNHIIFDLQQSKAVLQKFALHRSTLNIALDEKTKSLVNQIDNVLNI